MLCPKCREEDKDVNLDVNEKEHQFCPECGWENSSVQVGLWYHRMLGFGQANLLTEPQLKKILKVFKASYPDIFLDWINDNACRSIDEETIMWL